MSAAKKSKSSKGKKSGSSKKEDSTSSSPNLTGSRKTLSEYRVIQRNLVYVIGISARIAHENILKEPEYFGQYGKIVKIVVNRRNLSNAASAQTTTGSNGGATSATSTGPSASAYITFVRKEDAAKAIGGVDGSVFDGRVLRATYGTTKYCSFFLRGMACTNTGCMYLHEEGEHVDSFTKDELAAGKLHLHSYVLDKSEAAGMKQFGVVQAKPSTAPPQQQQATIIMSKPSTPSPPPPPPPQNATVLLAFSDKTPLAFFEKIRGLASHMEDPLKEESSHQAEPMVEVVRPQSPPMVLLPRRSILAKFDPFQPSNDFFNDMNYTAPPGAPNRPPPPAPIGSPLSNQKSTSAPLRFSESLGQPAPTPYKSAATVSANNKLEPSVEQFFNLFCNEALSTNQEQQPSHHHQQQLQQQQNHRLHPRHRSENLQNGFNPAPMMLMMAAAAAQGCVEDSKETSHLHSNLVQVPPTQQLPNRPQQTFSNIFEDIPLKRTSSPTPTQIPTTPTSAAVKPALSQPATKSTAKKTKAAKIPIVIEEPVFSDQNAFSILSSEVQPVTRPSLPPTPTPKRPVTSTPQVTKQAKERLEKVEKQQTTIYERLTSIPKAIPQEVASVDLTSIDLPALEKHIIHLQTAIKANQDQTRRLESFMREILAKSSWSNNSNSTNGSGTR